MDVYWLEQIESDVPAGNDWLSPAEAVRLDAMRFAKRRGDWRLGRWTAKQALAAHLNLPADFEGLRAIELRAAPCGAPDAYFANQPAPVSISLSHCNATALCAVAPAGVALGCDLELVEPRSDGFLADYFTPEEQRLVASTLSPEQPRLTTLLWSAKESALKALRTGLRLDTRSVNVSPGETLDKRADGWRPLQVRCAGGEAFLGWWQEKGGLVRSLIAAPPPLAPIPLHLPG